MSKKTSLGIGLAVIIFAGTTAFFTTHVKTGTPHPGYTPPTSNPPTSVSADTSTSKTVATTATAKTYTLADIAKHTDAASCWTTINGGVYDVTSWIDQHPGGREAILSLCGVDGSDAFNGQHGGQRRPASELAGFKIGTLAQ